jgi:pimeloyl-ACP methyl ester carboxylesterase
VSEASLHTVLVPGPLCSPRLRAGFPVLVDAGARDELAGAIPGAQRTIIEDCGHMSALERPAAVGAALSALLRAAT